MSIKKLIKLFNIFSVEYVFHELYQSEDKKSANIRDLAERYLKYHKMMQELAERKGAKISFFIQPYVGSGKRPFSKFETASNAHIYRRTYQNGERQTDINDAFYKRIKYLTRDNKNYFDLTDIFDQHTGEIWFDQCHFSDIGTETIAKKMIQSHFAD